ncbi:AraC family transcriptional regulator [Myroides odoratimimus]|uniref:AraC family transcriptional regulator n=1 Tax=Myroides odoratimimus TaxID=76832 RepID=UPI002575F930|nr:helix-turn-helix domain-containing protein [Myroides odoratimimus]MDM1528409.1 helix-turn-helix domain-containing protein [Myroides odoratimimus]
MENNSIPIYNICNLLDNNNISQDCVVYRLEEYISNRPNMVSAPHRHAFYQILFVAEGKGIHSIDFEKFSIEEKCLFYLNPSQVHKWEFEPGTKGFLINFNDNFLRTFLVNPNYLKEFTFFGGNAQYSKFSCEKCYETLHTKFEKMYYASLENQPLQKDYIKVLMLELFLETQLFLVKKVFEPEEPNETKGAHFIIKNFEKLVEDHFIEKRLPGEYADMLHITPNHLNSLCKKVIGITAGEVIRNRVILECKRLLVNADLSITEISYELDFKNNAYFSRFFKKNTGLSPEEFRKQN